ncbi:MAG TPA: FAD-dependent oxidoreductase [Desulfatiglandales bacterium]|nr:FAD-dependent oxidoreductase [Desulfatiglandales bacterium]
MSTPIKIKCTISSIDAHSDSVFTVKLKPARRLPRFKPGQFLHLALDSYDPTGGYWPESRVFSIASAPFDSEITIAYAVKGKFTLRMKEELEVGKDVWIKLPYGHFVVSSAPDEEVVLVAGGTGITPFIPFLLKEIKNPLGKKIRLIYGARRPELLIFGDVIADVLADLNGFKFQPFCEESANTKPQFPVAQGRLTIDAILRATTDPTKAVFYLSGPVEMINIFKNGLRDTGISDNNIRIDEWE